MSGNHIQYKTIYSSRRTLGLSILRDGSVVVRAPYRTSDATIEKLIRTKSDWIIKHTTDITKRRNPVRLFIDGEKHFFMGSEMTLRIVSSRKPYCKFLDQTIEIGTNGSNVRNILYRAYTDEAARVFPSMLNDLLRRLANQHFRVTKLIIRTMKSRWGSCSSSGKISLNTELIRLPEKLVEYVIIHELCHLKHHNHGAGFYELLEELCPDWKSFRKELKKHII